MWWGTNVAAGLGVDGYADWSLIVVLPQTDPAIAEPEWRPRPGRAGAWSRRSRCPTPRRRGDRRSGDRRSSSADVTLTASGITASTAVATAVGLVRWSFFIGGDPLLVDDLAVARHLPAGGSRAGGRHLNFHDYRGTTSTIACPAWTSSAAPTRASMLWSWASPAPTAKARPNVGCWRLAVRGRWFVSRSGPRSCGPSHRGERGPTSCARCRAWFLPARSRARVATRVSRRRPRSMGTR